MCQLRVGDAEFGGQIAPKIVKHGIAALHELTKDFLAFRMLQVEAETPFIAIESLIEVAVTRPEKMGSDRAPHIATVVEIFDLDHLRTEVGEVLSAERPGAILFDRDDAHAG